MVDKAVVPLENSIEGTVSMTLDYLYDTSNIVIEAEAVMPISHQLMIHPSHDNSEEIEKIYSHPQALAQSYHFLNKNYPEVVKQEFASTVVAAKSFRNSRTQNCGGSKFVCSKIIWFKNHQ